jgi:hypothetical protein
LTEFFAKQSIREPIDESTHSDSEDTVAQEEIIPDRNPTAEQMVKSDNNEQTKQSGVDGSIKDSSNESAKVESVNQSEESDSAEVVQPKQKPVREQDSNPQEESKVEKKSAIPQLPKTDTLKRGVPKFVPLIIVNLIL